MLNILNKKQNIKNHYSSNIINNCVVTNDKSKLNYIGLDSQQWQETLYSYNNIYNKSINNNSKIISNLIKIVLTSFISKLIAGTKKTKISRKLKRLRKKRLFITRILLSRPWVKHTNNKAIVTVYRHSYIKRFHKKPLIKYAFLAKSRRRLHTYIRNIKNALRGEKMIIGDRFVTMSSLLSRTRTLHKKVLGYKEVQLLSFLECKLKSKGKQRFLNKSLYRELALRNITTRRTKRKFIAPRKGVILTSRTLHVEKSKVNILNYRAKSLINILKDIYQKNIVLDIVNQKSKIFNSDILSSFIISKIKQKKRRWMSPFFWVLRAKYFKKERVLKQNFNSIDTTNSYKKADVYKFLRFKTITGLKLKASGRLTRRRTASKSILKKDEKGFLRNMHDYGLNRNDLSLNIQYNKLNNKTRNGAYGIRCWIASS